MKLRYFILFLIAASCLTFAQKKRYLVTPYQEVIPLEKGESARMLMEARVREAERAKNAACSNSVIDGFTTTAFPVTSRFGAYHKDVMGEWFQVRFTGRIDTFFWYGNGTVGALDSTLYVRIHKSNIGPTAGPGIRPGPYNPPCQNWGYWKNTGDLDQLVAAFPEDATDTAWVSTYADTSVKTFRPFDVELWGLGGFPVTTRQGQNSLPLDVLPTPLDVVKGDVIFLSMRVNGPPGHPVPHDERTEFAAAGFSSAPPEYQEYYPSRNWKFYEHDSGPSNCAGIPINNTKRGWVARGGFEDDTLSVAAYNYWYSISTNDNTPPQLLSSNTLPNTLSTDPRTVTAELEDCDPSNPAEAGIASAVISYSINGAFVGTIPMDNLGANTFVGELPGQPEWTSVSYSIVVTDTKGLVSNFPQGSYRVVALKNDYFTTVVSSGCTTNDIKNTGTEIPASALFYHPNTDQATTNVKDDGSAGPFALGTPFNLFGKQLNYAWVSVNGAIALSTAATETLDVSAAGFYSSFDFPGTVRRHEDPRDTAGTGRKPYNFISGLWADLIYGDTAAGSQYGRILYEDLGTKFVVQWDSLAIFDANGDHYLDEMIFRIVLDKSNGNISFEYDNIGTGGSDTLARIGVQVDSIPALGEFPWIYVNINNAPTETTPINGRCITLMQGGGFAVGSGWNMVSVPVTPSSFAKATLFPTAMSDAFRFEGGYFATDPLINGDGYWVKFSSKQNVTITGSLLPSLTIPLALDWNLIGSVSGPVTAPTGDCFTSQFYGFSGGYVPVTSLEPGKAYWVKSTGGCDLVLNSGSSALPKSDARIAQLNGFSKITVRDFAGGEQTMYLAESNALKVPVERFELPPVPPVGAFDARFASNRTVETYSNENGKVGEYVINIQSSSYPVVLQWNVIAKGKSVVISENGEGKNLGTTILNGTGTVRITNPSVSSIKVRVVDDLGLPKEFALGQNYPNPFNPVTRFNVAIPQTGDVEISVFDILGRKVSTIISGELQAGYKTIEWDGRDFGGNASPTGMYFVRMTAGDFSEVQKIMLLK